MKTSFPKSYHNMDRYKHRLAKAIDGMPERVDQFAGFLSDNVAVEDGDHRLYIWSQHGSWYAKAIRKADNKLVKVSDINLINVFALLCEQLKE